MSDSERGNIAKTRVLHCKRGLQSLLTGAIAAFAKDDPDQMYDEMMKIQQGVLELKDLVADWKYHCGRKCWCGRCSACMYRDEQSEDNK